MVLERVELGRILRPTGKCTSKIATQEYCPGVGGGTHPLVGGSGFQWSMDIGFETPGPQLLDFVGSVNIKSIKTTWRPGIVCSGSPSGGIDDAIQIDMYSGVNATGVLIGNILYAHAYHENPTNGTYNTFVQGSRATVTGLAWQPIGQHSCYQGIHTHLEAKGVSGYNTTLGSCSGSCGFYPCTTYSVTWLYEFFK